MDDGVNLRPVLGVPLAKAGDDPFKLLMIGLHATGLELRDGDVLAVASKLLSRCEGRLVRLAEATASAHAVRLAEQTHKDPRLVQVILDASSRVSRTAPNVLITQHALGYVSANAGVDASNVPDGGDVLLLPVDPDATARDLAAGVAAKFGVQIAVVVTDSFGRPFRSGTVGVALGSAGIEPLRDRRGDTDLHGRVMQATLTATVDAIAAAADLVMGQGAEGIPAVVVRGLAFARSADGARSLCRDPEADLYV
jgi:coenzyme F420-0:L-glutamate ligase / coenzyme F420-1:gamma-L-glutamate ligase